jgi:signal transduction histidine kinase
MKFLSVKISPLRVLYILIGYVLLQFCWWTYMLVDLNKKILQERLLYQHIDEVTYNEKLNNKIFMIFGEGFVFLIILVVGGYYTYQSFKKEVELSQQKSNFLLSTTHELKTPLASLKLFLQTIQKRTLDAQKMTDLSNNAIHEVDRLHVIVDNMLTANQIENNNFKLDFKRISFSNYLKELLLKYELLYENRIISNIQNDIYGIADEQALTSIFSNLIDNAIKYSSDKVNVSLSQQNNFIVFSVSDQGIGISNKEKKKIFTMFYRTENENTRSFKGTGLGLYIVKYLVEKQKGMIEIKDNNPKGSIFEVKFLSDK